MIDERKKNELTEIKMENVAGSCLHALQNILPAHFVLGFCSCSKAANF